MNVYTHAGLFHADEVTAYAILLIMNPDNFTLHRLTDVENIPEDGVVLDIGREHEPNENKYDHHQGFFPRPNGVPLATAGMVWHEFGAQIIQNLYPHIPVLECRQAADRVDERLIQGIDAHDADNAYKAYAECSAGKVNPTTISNVVSGYNFENAQNHAIQKKLFLEAASVMLSVVMGAIRNAVQYLGAVEKFHRIAEPSEDGKVIWLPTFLPWREIVHNDYPECRFVIMPSNHPGSPWSLFARTVEPDSRELMVEIDRPDWFKGFIHQGKWIAGCQSIEEAEKLAAYNL